MKNQNHSDKMPHARTDRLVIQDMEEEMLVYDLDADKATCLNQASRIVWQNCDGRTSISDMSRLIGKELNITASKEFVVLALRELSESNLIDDSENKFEMEPPVSRRDLITRYGVPMAALPIVMSLVAPVSAQMTSCVPVSQPCTPTGLPCCVGFVCVPSGPGMICQD